MRRQIFLPITFLIFGVLSFSSFLFFVSASKLKGADELVSPVISEPPIENLYNLTIYEKVKQEKTTDNYPPNDYFPESLDPISAINLDLSSNSYAVMDRETNELLMAKNLTQEKQIASLTKIMTAILALEKEKLTKEIVISKQAAEIGEAFMGVSPGERYTLEELLYGLIMVSGNDAAESIAENLGRGRFWFIEEMNKKANSLGMKDTYFVNPTGLDEETADISSFSTALDLLALANYALDNKTFAQICATQEYFIPQKEDIHKGISLYSLLSFDKTYPGIKGIKTGNTTFANQTLVSYAEAYDRKILMVLLDSQATRDDAIKIYRYIFEGRTDWP